MRKNTMDDESLHRDMARKVAAEGIVLLKNLDHTLPISKRKKISVYGAGALETVKGGTGSGDVNVREKVSIWEGLEEAGYRIANLDWKSSYLSLYEKERLAWRDKIRDKMEQEDLSFWDAYVTTPFFFPGGELPKKEGGSVALYCLSRTAGEGADRTATEGDWYISKEEKRFLIHLSSLYSTLVLVINAGGMIDLSFCEEIPNLKAVLYVSQPGMEAGRAIADVISGAVNPSGKLTDTWAHSGKDYPSWEYFGDEKRTEYREGIYVGYRYFDTFEVPCLYSFGYGLSYTKFSMSLERISLVSGKVALTLSGNGEAVDIGRVLTLNVKVTNTGDTYAGREVVQVYAACPPLPNGGPFRKLVGFLKTGEIAPGESQKVTVQIPVTTLAVYDEDCSSFCIIEGVYGIYLGNSLMSSVPVASVMVTGKVVIEHCTPICPCREDLWEIEPDMEAIRKRRKAMLEVLADCPSVDLGHAGIQVKLAQERAPEPKLSWKVRELVEELSTQELVQTVTGDVTYDQNGELGAAGTIVPGSAAQTTSVLEKKGVRPIALADGPAGLRLARDYRVVDGKICQATFEASVEDGLFYQGKEKQEGELHHQYCTAIPVGTCLAQTWDLKMVREVGGLIAEEMKTFGVSLWLAPGMNIHRHPLCGRNFEYFSEDPVLTGCIAAALSQGVQKTPGCGVTIKHFACNNQEKNRKFNNSILSERVLREIYLRGFGLAVKWAKPAAIMTSYNLVNGVHAANSYDLCTKVLRGEWGFEGVVMTDWTTTNEDENCTASGCMRAGNDLVMPGQQMDHDNLLEELEKGTLSTEDLKRCASRIIQMIWKLTGVKEE